MQASVTRHVRIKAVSMIMMLLIPLWVVLPEVKPHSGHLETKIAKSINTHETIQIENYKTNHLKDPIRDNVFTVVNTTSHLLRLPRLKLPFLHINSFGRNYFYFFININAP